MFAKIHGQRIDLIERPTIDDRHLGNGFGTLNFAENPFNSEFSHSLGQWRPFPSDR